MRSNGRPVGYRKVVVLSFAPAAIHTRTPRGLQSRSLFLLVGCFADQRSSLSRPAEAGTGVDTSTFVPDKTQARWLGANLGAM